MNEHIAWLDFHPLGHLWIVVRNGDHVAAYKTQKAAQRHANRLNGEISR